MITKSIYIAFAVLLFILCFVVITVVVITKQKTYLHNKNQNNIEYVTYPRLGKNGRLGNQLFQMSATISLAKRLGRCGPSSFVSFSLTNDDLQCAHDFYENSCFEFTNWDISEDVKRASIGIDGYRQNPRYFNHMLFDIRQAFKISQKLKVQILDIYPFLADFCIGVHVRRGDYVDNQVHEVCNKNVYEQGIKLFVSIIGDKNVPILFISDDIEWCKKNFEHNANIYFSKFQADYEDFACLSMCSHKVISNSTFAWWACFLDARFDAYVFAPKPWIHDSFATPGCNDLYDETWYIFDTIQNQITYPCTTSLAIGAYYQCFKQPTAFINV